MKNADNTPIYESTSRPRYGNEAIIRIHNLQGDAEIVVKADDATELVVPAKFLKSLGALASATETEIQTKIDEIQRAHNHPLKVTSNLSAASRASRWNSGHDEFRTLDLGVTAEPYLTTILFYSGSNPNEDGTPYLEWGKHSETDIHGWRLRLAGIPDVNLSWAEWNDPDAIADLLNMAKNPEDCVVLSAVVAPQETSQMTSRIVARSLRTGRKLPGINMKKIRQIFADNAAALLPQPIEGQNSWRFGRSRPQAKLLTIVSGEKRIPVAVAIVAPQHFVGQREMTKAQTESMSLQERREFDTSAYLEKLTPWLAECQTIFYENGWRKVDLPKPRYHWGSTESSIQWFTLLNEELWSSVAPAAKNFAATEFSLSRSTQL